MCAQITPSGVASAATSATRFAEHIGGSARGLSESICHSARCHTAGETCYQNVEPVLGDQHGGSKLDLVLLVVGSQVGSHRRSTWGHIEPATPFDSGCSPGIQRRPATSADTRDLVRIEGSRCPMAHEGQSDSRVVGSQRRPPPAMALSILFSFTRTLVKITRSRGAKQGATADSVQATLSHFQPPSTQLNPTSGDIRTPPDTHRRCLLSSGSRVRILPGAPGGLDQRKRLTVRRGNPTSPLTRHIRWRATPQYAHAVRSEPCSAPNKGNLKFDTATQLSCVVDNNLDSLACRHA